MIAPYWDRTRHTGYGRALRETFRGLYGEDDLTAETLQPGFYATILKRANIESCQVNSVERIFMESEQPALLAQDLSINEFSRCNAVDLARVKAETRRYPTTLEEWLDIIDFYFATYGPKAVAVKCWIAYSRALNFAPVAKLHASRLFPRHLGGSGGTYVPRI